MSTNSQIVATVFSRDRACQLDLLLKSIEKNAPDLFRGINVIWKASTPRYNRGYEICREEHEPNENVVFWGEKDFQPQVESCLTWGGDYSVFLCDDDIFYKKFEGMRPDVFLQRNPGVLCVSLRLGLNTNYCYPLRRPQRKPTLKAIDGLFSWKWLEADADWGYPGSLDGHIFRRPQLRLLVGDTYTSPNTLEEQLNRNCHRTKAEYMACYPHSFIVGNPINLVNESHPNRHGDFHFKSAEDLNDHYLRGGRVNLDSLKFAHVLGAHTEVEFTLGP